MADDRGSGDAAASPHDVVVLVTGGGGYVGSHCVEQLLQAGFKVVAVDNYVNSVRGAASVF